MEKIIVKILKCKNVKFYYCWEKGIRKPNKKQLYLNHLINKDIKIYKYRIKHTNPKIFELPF